MTEAHYLDTSALVKLVVLEAESDALFAFLSGIDTLVTSDLSRTELHRAVRRAASDRRAEARQVLDSLTILRVRTADFEAAGRLDPPSLRGLDAIHLAIALSLGDDLRSIVTYDERMSDAAHHLGIGVTTPT